jgi:hypothetical protein
MGPPIFSWNRTSHTSRSYSSSATVAGPWPPCNSGKTCSPVTLQQGRAPPVGDAITLAAGSTATHRTRAYVPIQRTIPANDRSRLIGAPFVGALECESRCVTVAGHGRHARSAVMIGDLVTNVAARSAPEREICAGGCVGRPTWSSFWSALVGRTVARVGLTAGPAVLSQTWGGPCRQYVGARDAPRASRARFWRAGSSHCRECSQADGHGQRVDRLGNFGPGRGPADSAGLRRGYFLALGIRSARWSVVVSEQKGAWSAHLTSVAVSCVW